MYIYLVKSFGKIAHNVPGLIGYIDMCLFIYTFIYIYIYVIKHNHTNLHIYIYIYIYMYLVESLGKIAHNVPGLIGYSDNTNFQSTF
jgi:hypothetical protein